MESFIQYDKDLNSPSSKLFLKVEKLIIKLIKDEVSKRFCDNITSYITSYGMFCYLKTKGNYLHIGWNKGALIPDKYNLLSGYGKIVRGQKITSLNKETKESIKYYIEQTRIILFEIEANKKF